MEPRKAELKKVPETHTDERKRRFRIEKLEERIAPRFHYKSNSGWGSGGSGGHCGGGCSKPGY
jgi:hypothetical protein